VGTANEDQSIQAAHSAGQINMASWMKFLSLTFEYDYAGLISPAIHFENFRAKLNSGAAFEAKF
jgi:hypothetical protein